MKTNDFFVPVSSAKLVESFEKQFGSHVNLDKYTREELEDMRNKLRTRVFQHEGSSKYNDLLTNEVYQRDKAMLQLLNTRIKEMLGEAKKGVRDVKRTKKSKGTKPDFLDIDKDGNKSEPMKKAIKDKKLAEKKEPSAAERAKSRDQQRSTPAKKARNVSQRNGVTQDKDGTHYAKESKMKEEVKKSQIPAAQRKAKGGDWKVSQADLDKEASSSTSSAAGLAKHKANLKSQGVMEEPAKKSEVPAALRKAKGGDWKVSQADLDKEAGRSTSSSTGLAKRKAELKSQGVMETGDREQNALWAQINDYERKARASRSDLKKSEYERMARELRRKLKSDDDVSEAAPSAGMTKKEKSTVVKKARAGKDIGKPGKGFEKVEKAAKKSGAKDPKAVAAAAMWKQQAKESFRRNVRVVNESLAHYLMEDEEGKAKTITAASDIVNDYTSWMQRVGQYQTKAIIELADAIRADFGVQQSEQFKQSVAPALAATLETLTQQREAISNAVAVLAGEDMPEEPMGMEPEVGPESPEMEPAGPDMMNEPNDEFGASDAAAGPGLTGREMRESRFARKLAESHSIMAKLAK